MKNTEDKVIPSEIETKKEQDNMEILPNPYDKFAIGAVELLIRFVFILILGVPFTWIWNMILPDMFCFPHVSYLQSVGLMVLGELLFTTKVEFN